MGCFDTSSSKSTSSSKTKAQKKDIERLLDLFFPSGGPREPEAFPGQTTADLTTLQQTGIQGAADIGTAFTSPVSTKGIQGSELFPEVAASTAGLLTPLDKPGASRTAGISPFGPTAGPADISGFGPTAGPANIQAATAVAGASPISKGQFGKFFKRAVKDPARKEFREETTPAISEAFAGPGFFSTARSKEIVKQKTDLEARLSSELAAGQISNLERNQQLQEAAAGRDITRDQIDLARQQFNVGFDRQTKQFEQTLNFSTEQFNKTFDRQTEQFAQSLNLTRGQFNESLQKSREEFTQTIGLSFDKLNTARTELGFRQALTISDEESNTLIKNIAVAASQIQGLKEIIGIGAVEQSQEQAEIFAEIEEFALENQIVDSQDLAIIMGLLGIDFSTRSQSGSGAGLGFEAVAGLF